MKKEITLDALKYISAGVVCFAIILLEHSGLLKKIIRNIPLNSKDIANINDNVLLNKAILELKINRIIRQESNHYLFTAFGHELIKYLGLVKYIYHGYSLFFSNQLEDAPYNSREMRIDSIIEGSNDLAKKFFDPVIIKAIKKLNVRGTICDLGCGDGSRLKKVCKLFLCEGLGIERTLKNMKSQVNNEKVYAQVRLQKGDITNLKKQIWPNVNIIMQTMVMHDITPAKKCINVINSYLKNFPNLKFFLYCDNVAPSLKLKSQLPGFDYIHGLLNVKTRNYEETIELLNLSKFQIIQEYPILDLPNTFLWVLSPKSSKRKQS